MKQYHLQKKVYKRLKDDLIERGIIENHKFMCDYEFRLPSAAASVVCGSSANGANKEWRDASGKTVGEIAQE